MPPSPAVVRFVVRDLGPEEFSVKVLRGTSSIGSCRVKLVPTSQMVWFQRSSCAPALKAARRATGRRLRMFLVRNSNINDSERGTGIGVAMYICATKEAAARGGALSPEYCLGYGGTSDSARRVWSSRRLAAAVAVFDGCLAYGGAEIEPGAFASSASR